MTQSQPTKGGGVVRDGPLPAFEQAKVLRAKGRRSRTEGKNRNRGIAWSSVADLSRRRLAAQQSQNFASDVTRINIGSKIHVSRCYLFRLGRALHRSVSAELRDLFRWLVGRIQRRPNRPRRNAVHANAFLNQVL